MEGHLCALHLGNHSSHLTLMHLCINFIFRPHWRATISLHMSPLVPTARLTASATDGERADCASVKTHHVFQRQQRAALKWAKGGNASRSREGRAVVKPRRINVYISQMNKRHQTKWDSGFTLTFFYLVLFPTAVGFLFLIFCLLILKLLVQ